MSYMCLCSFLPFVKSRTTERVVNLVYPLEGVADVEVGWVIRVCIFQERKRVSGR